MWRCDGLFPDLGLLQNNETKTFKKVVRALYEATATEEEKDQLLERRYAFLQPCLSVHPGSPWYPTGSGFLFGRGVKKAVFGVLNAKRLQLHVLIRHIDDKTRICSALHGDMFMSLTP